MASFRILLLATGCCAVVFCTNPETLENEADGTITGQVLPGAAVGAGGPIYVAASHTNEPENVDWSAHSDVLTRFGEYEIKELVGGRYYIAAYLDANRNGQLDSGDFWGGHDANGDGRLDLVILDGGKTLRQDITLIKRF